jgi:acyl-CoA synthetase (AMP-forming)/AMP-acid ligase II
VGEVVISGPNVTPGYEGNPRPTPRASSRPTASAGSAPATRATFDADGYLTLTGRLKEIINRGGEKVSPLEVDGVSCRRIPPSRRS